VKGSAYSPWLWERPFAVIGLLYSADDPTQVGPLLSGVQLLTVR